MESGNFYVHNLETDKLNIFTSKPFYKQLPLEKKKAISRYCLWSRPQDCWVSKAKAGNCYRLIENLNEMGFLNGGTRGEKISFEEQQLRKQHRAAERAVNSDNRAKKAEERSEQLFEKAHDMASIIPFGQPILVGHHSEKRDRNYRNRIHNTMRKAFEEEGKAKYYRNKKENAVATAEAIELSNAVYLGRRLKECQKNIRLLHRRLEGKFYTYSEPRAISEKDKAFYTERLDEENEKMSFYVKCMKKIDPDFRDDFDATKRKTRGAKL